MVLGTALIALHGAKATQVEASYTEALNLVNRLGDATRRFPVLWGLWYVAYNQGDYPVAQQRGERLLEDAKVIEDTGRLLEAHHALWATAKAMGETISAAAHCEHGLVLYDRERHASQALPYGGHDPGACARFQLAVTQWLLGYPDRSVVILKDALLLAAELNHPMTSTITFWHAAWIYYERGEYDATAQFNQRLLDVGTAHGFVAWLDSALVLSSALAREPVRKEALAELAGQLTQRPAALWVNTFSLCLLAELCLAIGCFEEDSALSPRSALPIDKHFGLRKCSEWRVN
jgi:tetratricopeptide (TPR) repeat protein